MIKKTLYILSVTVLASCGGEKAERMKASFSLKGTLANGSGQTIYFEKLTPEKSVPVDSCVLDENGNFAFTTYVPLMGFYRVKVSEQNFAMVVADSSDKITITGSAKDLGNTYKAEGSPETKLFLEYNEMAKVNRTRIDSLQQAFQFEVQDKKLDSVGRNELGAKYELIFNKIIDDYGNQVAEKIKANSDMFSSIMALQPLDPAKYTDVFLALDKGLMKKYPDNDNVRMFHQMVSKNFGEKGSIGMSPGGDAPEINQESPEGKKIALSSFKGKVVLIDFWASWCGPCRKEMPHVKEIYAKYKGMGLEILGVSLDDDKDAWINAIQKDGLTWPQVSDLGGWKNEAAQVYGVQAIPHTVLVDKNGKITAIGLRGSELDDVLKNIFTAGSQTIGGPGNGHSAGDGHNHSH
jgi:thiol-disulfide isomerase/thioredoxin